MGHDERLQIPISLRRLTLSDERLRIAQATLVAIDHAAEVIGIVSSAGTFTEAEAALQERFSLDELQAKVILDTQFRRVLAAEREFYARVVAENERLRNQDDRRPRRRL